MLRLSAPPAPAPSPLMQVAGRLALVAVGLAVLALVAVVAALLAAPPRAASAPAPQVWLASLAPAPVSPFADALPPALTPRHAPPVAARPQGAPAVAQAPVVDPVATPVAEAMASPTRPRPRPAATEAVPLATLRAPTRSPLPRLRPFAPAEAIVEGPVEAAPALAAFDPGGLLRSLLPAPRPETVTRLASLDLATPAPEAVDEAPRTALTEAILGDSSCGSGLTRAIPRRSNRMAAGSSVVAALDGAGGRSRDAALVEQIVEGNLPPFLRALVPVTLTSGRTRVTLCVMPDYLAVGSDEDFVRVPLGLPGAMRVAEAFDMVLPTTRMVDAIHAQASVRLSPSPMQAGAQMASTAYFRRHNATVEDQRSRAGARLGQLVSGHKKDLVLTNRLNANPGRVAIYGWHRSNGAPIQPLSTVHGADYADYSHGIRLISRTAYVNGRAIDLRDLLADSRLAGLVSSEGTITHRQLLAALD